MRQLHSVFGVIGIGASHHFRYAVLFYSYLLVSWHGCGFIYCICICKYVNFKNCSMLFSEMFDAPWGDLATVFDCHLAFRPFAVAGEWEHNMQLEIEGRCLAQSNHKERLLALSKSLK